MQTPWQILTLDPSTATERDLKAAYARLLRQHRPDTDPEGFQRVREAYDEALGYLRRNPSPSAASEQQSSPADPVQHQDEASSFDSPALSHHDEAALSKPPKPPVVEVPDNLAKVYADLLAAADESPANRLAVALTRFSTEALRLKIPAVQLCGLLHQALSGRAELLARHGSTDLLIHLLRGGETAILFEIIKAWDDTRSIASAAMLAMAIDREKYQPGDEESALVLAHIARLIAFFHTGLANGLANAAYPLLPRDGREQIMGFLENQIALGRMFFGFPAEMQRFWQERLANRESAFDWSSPDAQVAVNYVIHNRGHSWEGLGVIEQLLPPDLWQQTEKTLRAQLVKAQRAQQNSGSGNMKWVWIAIVLVANLARMIGTSGSSSDNYSRPARTLPPIITQPSPPGTSEEERTRRLFERVLPKQNPTVSPTLIPGIAPPVLSDHNPNDLGKIVNSLPPLPTARPPVFIPSTRPPSQGASPPASGVAPLTLPRNIQLIPNTSPPASQPTGGGLVIPK